MKQARLFLYLVGICVFASILLQGQENRSPDSDENAIIVPAGTNITVEFKYPYHAAPRTWDAKVVWPIRKGWTTVVPAGTVAKVYVSTRYYNPGTADFAKVTSITLDNKEYRIATGELEVSPGFAGEMRFTLVSELKIKR